MPRVYRHHHEWLPDYNYGRAGYWENRPNLPWKDLTKKEKVKQVAKIIAPIALLAGFTVAALPNGPVDLLGDSGRLRTESEMNEQKAIKRQEVFAQDLAPSERFSLTFLGSDSLGIRNDIDTRIDVNSRVEHNGVLGLLNVIVPGGTTDIIGDNPYEDCLAGTSYDITPSQIRGRASGDINAVASINVSDNEVFVYPAASEANSLRFTIEDNGLLLPSSETVEILSAYGCK
jgi:hypothetical protein